MAISDWLDPDTSTLGSVLRFLDRPGQVVRNVARGEFGSALRQTVDFIGDVVDASVPFVDLIPSISRPEDYVSGADLVGVEDQPWYIKYPVGLGVDILTDPLTYLSGGATAVSKVSKGLGAAAARGRQMGLVSRSADDAAKALFTKSDDLAKQAAATGEDYAVLAQGMSDAEKAATAIKNQKSALTKEIDGLESMMRAGADSSTGMDEVAQALREARKRSKALDKQARDLGDLARAEVASGVVLRSQKDAVRSLVDDALTNAGRRKLTKAGNLDDTMQKVVGEIGEDFTQENVKRVLSRYPDLFRQDVLTVNFFGSKAGIPQAEAAYRAAKRGLGAALSKMPLAVQNTASMAAKGTGDAWQGIKRTMGWNWSDPVTKSMRRRASVLSSSATNYALKNAADIFDGIKPETDMLVSAAFDNLRYGPDGRVVGNLLPVADEAAVGVDDVLARLEELRLDPGDMVGGDFDRAADIIRQVDAENVRLWNEWLENGVVSGQEGRTSYLRRSFKGKLEDVNKDLVLDFDNASPSQLAAGMPNSLRSRGIETSEDLADFLTKNENVLLERSAVRRFVERAEQQGQVVGRARIARELLGETEEALGEMAPRIQRGLVHMASKDKDQWNLLRSVFENQQPRGGVLKVLAKANRWFKPAAVYGLFIPRISGVTRNQTAGVWQALPAGWDMSVKQVRQVVDNATGAVGAAIGKVTNKGRKWGGEIGADLKKLNEVIEGSRSAKEAMRALEAYNPTLAAAFREGVFDNFVTSEGLVRSIMTKAQKSRIRDWADMPGEMFGYIENAMRWGMYKDLASAGMSAKTVANRVADSFLDYGTHSAANRTLRDIIPFAAFTSQTIPQQIRLLVNRPVVGVGLASVMRGGGQPVTPWIGEQPYIELDDNTYLTSLGLPIEALNVIPDFSGDVRSLGKDIRRGILGQTQPLLKTAIGATIGEDVYFPGTPFGSYDVTPQALSELAGAPERSAASREWRTWAVGTGLAQPIQTPLNMVSQLVDSRKTPGQRLLNALTGARIVTDDPDKAMVQILQEQLRTDPEANVYRSYYGGSDETNQMIQALKDAKKRLKQKREALEQASVD